MPYEVFLCHNSTDKPLVRSLYAWLRDKLGARKVFFDESEIVLGDVIPAQEAMTECSCALICFGPKGTGPWHEQEIWSLLTKAINRSRRAKDSEDFRMIPILLEGANPEEIPDLFQPYQWADFRHGISKNETTLNCLLSAILGEKRGSSDRKWLRPLAGLAARMNPNDAASVAERLAKALESTQETGTFRLRISSGVLADLAVQIDPARQTRTVALSGMFLGQISTPPKDGESEKEDRIMVARICKSLEIKELANVLKWPFCVGEAQKLVLAELERKSNPPLKFDDDLWKFVEQAPNWASRASF